MKKLVIWSVICVATWSCGNPNRFVIEGRLPQMEAVDTVYLISQFAPEQPQVAAAPVSPKTGAFTIKGTVEHPEMVVLTNRQRQGMGIIFLEPGKMQLERAPLGYLRVIGTPSNDAYAEFQERMNVIDGAFMSAVQAQDTVKIDSLQHESMMLMAHTIEANTGNLAGLYLFNQSLGNLDAEGARALAERFDPALQEHPLMQAVKKTITAWENTAIGRPYMDIALPGLDGQIVKLSDVATGKWTLIDFWATWCGPCRQELPFLRQAFEEYSDKGFTIYGVSLDSDVFAWQSLVRRDEGANFPWHNVIGVENGKAASIIEEYAVRTIPTNYLISPEGKIVAKDLRGSQLLEKLEEVM